ncbi:MAG: hypothetical protein IJQ16_00940, partial [Selenomonadaceae bacterium]|nr:hypothetical protein [Selenomonadaceae bacterium]
MELQNKKVLVIGAGISGFAAAKIAKKFGADVTLSDAKNESDFKGIGNREQGTENPTPYSLLPTPSFDELRKLEINLTFGKQEEKLLDGVNLVIVSPAVPL